MLRITVELCPRGDTSRPKHLGTAYIINDGSGDPDIGNYDVALSKWGKPNQQWKSGRVEGFPRAKRGPWDLLFLALQSCVEKRNKKKGKP